MFEIHGKSVGEAWIKYLTCVLEHGYSYHDDKDETIELDDVVLSIEKDLVPDLILDTFADKKVRELYMKKMQTTDIIPELNQSYGKRIFDQQGINQYDWCLKRLQNKPESKAATMTLLLPNDPGPRIPCLDIVDFKLRNNNLLTKVFFRSQNAMNSYGNFCSCFWLSRKFAADLNVDAGSLTVFVSNAHIYSNMVSAAQKIVDEARIK